MSKTLPGQPLDKVVDEVKLTIFALRPECVQNKIETCMLNVTLYPYLIMLPATTAESVQ